MMIKKNLKTLIISSLLTLLPIPIGFALWNVLPNTMAIHWGANGEADGFGSKLFVILFIPLLLLAVHWLMFMLSVLIDKRNTAQNPKMIKVVLYTMPTISIIISCISYAISLEWNVAPLLPAIISIPTGVGMLIMGNYLPKCRQNFTMGIKIGPTLRSEANWNATHRFAGKIWFVCGALLLLCSLVPFKFMFYPFLVIVMISTILPMIYSYRYQAKHPETVDKTRDGISAEKGKQTTKAAVIFTAIFVPVLTVILCVIMFTGNIHTDFSDNSFTVSATYGTKLTVSYDEVQNVEYMENFDGGQRVYGFGSARLLIGTFQSEQFGDYTRYTYTGKKPCVVVTSKDGDILIIGGKDAAETKAIYEKLKEATDESN